MIHFVSKEGRKSVDFSSESMDRKLSDSERRRWSSVQTASPGSTVSTQLMEDERLAMMLQNEEFLRELQGDDDFMETLQQGIDMSVVFAYTPCTFHIFMFFFCNVALR